MKKLLILLVITGAATSSLNAQELSLKKNNFILTPYVGLPNSSKVLLTGSDVGQSYSYGDVTYEVTGSAVCFGGKMAFMITDNISMGLEGNYEKGGYEGTFEGQYYDNNTGTNRDTSYNVGTYSLTKTRVLARFQYHFGISEKANFYTGMGLGLTTEKKENPENELNETSYNLFAPFVFIDRVTNPIAARIYIGSNIMFIPNLGMNIEFGFGSGSILQLGLVGKF